MTMSLLNRLVREERKSATIISDGCRDYVVEIRRPGGARLLRNRKGHALRFPSLAEARRAARADEVLLAVRIAADEACAGAPDRHATFSTLRLSS